MARPESANKLHERARNPRSSILYVIGSLDVGGTEHHLTQIIPRLKSLGWQPTVYCLTHRGSLASRLEQHGIEVITSSHQSTHRLATITRLLASSAYLLFLLLRRRPNIVHFFLPMSYLIGTPLAILARIPLRLMSRRGLNVYQRYHPFYRKIEIHLHARMHALIGNSNAIVHNLIAEGAPSKRVTLIYNGIDTADINAAPVRIEAAPLSEYSLKLIIVANLIPYKGHTDLIHALARIAPQLPPDWTLLCVGRDTGFGTKLVSLVQDLKLTEHIQFCGEQRDVLRLFSSADIGVLCSHEEGFSNAILEGMAVGLPMIVTNVGGNAEAVIHGKTGLVVPPHDPSALGCAILTLARDHATRLAMGRAGRERVDSEFSLERCVESYDRLYRALVDGRYSLPVESSIHDVRRARGVIKPPLVSVVIPVYNRTELLQRAIKSVTNQTISNLEVIVVDDGSTEDIMKTTRMITGIDIKVIKHNHRKGPAAARNTGIREAKGSYVAFLDSDDEWFPEKLEQQLKFLLEDEPHRQVCCTSYLLRKRGDEFEKVINAENSDKPLNFLWGCTLGPGTTLIASRGCFEQVGLFDERLERLEDWDWMLRCSQQYRVYSLSRPLARVYYSPDTADPVQVTKALQQIYMARYKYGLKWVAPSDLLKFYSTIFLERAGIHYRARHILRAIYYTTLSFFIYPIRNRQFFVTMIERLIGHGYGITPSSASGYLRIDAWPDATLTARRDAAGTTGNAQAPAERDAKS